MVEVLVAVAVVQIDCLPGELGLIGDPVAHVPCVST
jgi:hypothetical protein